MLPGSSRLSFLEHREQRAANHPVERLLVLRLMPGRGEHRVIRRRSVRQNEAAERIDRVDEPTGGRRQPHRSSPGSIRARIGQYGRGAVRIVCQRLGDGLGPAGEDGEVVAFERARAPFGAAVATSAC